jgi:uncharacterized protein YbaA (DUF1428 family)
MSYIDGFLCPVPTANKDAYHAFAAAAAVVFKDHGALSVVEGWGDDVPEGKVNSMRSAVLLEPHETVVFSWIVWPDKATRDAGMQKVFTDPRIEALGALPLDGKRMIFGGFVPIVEA